jgi:hypothetical protein
MLGQLNLNSIIMVALLNVIVALVYVGLIYGDSGDGSGGSNLPNGDNNGMNPGGKPPYKPYNYQHLHKENGSPYTSTYKDPSSVLEIYNPATNKPPQNDRELGILLGYKFNKDVRTLGYNNWTIKNTFPSNDFTDRISRAKLFNHIMKYRRDIPTAFNQVDISSDTPKWDQVMVTSFLVNSLNRSDD